MTAARLARSAPFLLLPWTWFLVRDLHPAADVVAVGLPVLVVVAVVAAVAVAAVRRRRVGLLTAGSWLAFGAVAVLGPWVPHDGPAPADEVRVVAANVHGDGTYAPSISDDLFHQAPDVVVVSEIGPALLEDLRSRFDRVVSSEPRAPGRRPDLAVATDLPVTDLGRPDGLEELHGVRARVDAAGGAFVLYALHLPPPRPRPTGDWEVSVREHRTVVEDLLDAVAAETLPVVVAGDLNLVDRTWGYRALTGALDDAMRSTWLRPTAERAPTLPLLARVDHLLVAERWCHADAAVFDLTGSDHRGVAATVGPCR